jgi:peroxiredoxin Q/BCP
MAQLRQDYESFKNMDTEVLVVGPENAEVFQKYWIKENLPFVGLPDPKHTLSGLYGQEVKVIKLGRLPCQMIIDKTGILRFVHYGSSMSDIPSNNKILKLLETIESS